MNRPAPAEQSSIGDPALRSHFGLDQADDSWFQRLQQAQSPYAMGRLGVYELLAEIGRGGQGTVYKATKNGAQTPVALKRLSAGTFATSSMKARFERELDIASDLSHPNIVRTHGVESIDGQQILEMEWIDGMPIDRWARPSPDSIRPTHEILEVFALVCDAVGYAHQRGVLHRDLKPSNILVDAAGQPHVLDFGLAKLTDAAGGAASMASLTHASGFMGTPAYTSPERISGNPKNPRSGRNADVRSDVFSLGVILYQMLTSALPFGPTDNIAELFDAIRRDEPKRPSQLKPELDIDIDAIVLKSLAKDQSERYQSMDAFAGDVRRYLKNEPVLAHPPSTMYLARKFVRRHRGLMIGVASVLAALVIGFAGTAWALVHARAAEQQTRKAERTSNQINDFLNQMLASADPSVIRAYDVPVSTMLDEAVKSLDGGALRGEPEAEAKVRMTIGETYRSLGLYPQARTQLGAAVDLRLAAFGEMNLDVAEAMLKLAPVLNREEVFDEAERLADRAIATRTALLGNDSVQTLEAIYVKGEDWAFGDRRLDAAKLLCELLPRAIQIEGSDQTDLVLQIKGILGYCGGCNNTPEDGLKYLQETLNGQRNRYSPDDDRINRTLINLGAVYQTLREPTKAEALLTEAADRRRRVLGNDHPMLGTALFNLAGAVNTTRGSAAAEPISREALTILERRLVPGHYEIVRTRGQLGSIILALKRYDEAEALFRQTLQESHDRPGKYEAKARTVRRMLGACLFRSNRFEEAETVLNDALQRVVPTDDTVELQKIAAVFAQLYKAWGKTDLADQWHARQADATLPLPNQRPPD